MLSTIGEKDGPPVPPLNLIGDFGGGALYMAVGVLAGVIAARTSGKGQVIDCSMVEGAASLATSVFGAIAAGTWVEQRGMNRNDGGAHFYTVYETKDGEHLTIGSIEPQFYALLLQHTGIDPKSIAPQSDRAKWPETKAKLAAVFKTKTRAEWTRIMQQTDICFAPVLRPSEAMADAHNVARESFVAVDGIKQPAPAPRFLGTPTRVRRPPAKAGEHTREVLADWGFGKAEIDALYVARAVA